MAESLEYHIRLTLQAEKMLTDISDLRIRAAIAKRINQLTVEPEKQGKALADDLSGVRSVRAVGQRYRVLYQVSQGAVVVLVVALGIREEDSRRDVYAQAQRLARLGLLGGPGSEPGE